MTSDADIVERLEDVGCDREPFTPDHAHCICRLASKAAAEITRLRSALEARAVPTEAFRETFAGIVQGSCEECGQCDDDKDGRCPCDRIVDELLEAIERISEEESDAASPPPPSSQSKNLVHSDAENAVSDGSVIGPVCQWQPIETAPLTGEQVDLWCRSPGIHGGGYARTADCWYSDGKWWRHDEQYGDDQCRTRVHNATHWMPLPPAPGDDDRTNDLQAQSGRLNQTLPSPSQSVDEEAIRADERERCAKVAHDLADNPQQILLHAGEMLRGELRSCRAILRFIAATIRRGPARETDKNG